IPSNFGRLGQARIVGRKNRICQYSHSLTRGLSITKLLTQHRKHRRRRQIDNLMIDNQRPLDISTRRRQRRERHVLQNTFCHNDEPLLSQLRGNRPEQHPAQLRSHRRIVCLNVSESFLLLGQRLVRNTRTTLRQQLVETLRLQLDRRPSWQLKRLNRIRRNNPHKTLLLAERILEQQRILVQHALLNLGHTQWRRLN